jgi:hypothetical protein
MALSRLASDIRSGQNSPAATFGKGLAFFLGAVTVVPVIADALTTQLAKHRGQPLFSSSGCIRERAVAPLASGTTIRAGRETKSLPVVAWTYPQFLDREKIAARDAAITGLRISVSFASMMTTAIRFLEMNNRQIRSNKDALNSLARRNEEGEQLAQSIRSALGLPPGQDSSVDDAVQYIEHLRELRDSREGIVEAIFRVGLVPEAQQYVLDAVDSGEPLDIDDFRQLALKFTTEQGDLARGQVR